MGKESGEVYEKIMVRMLPKDYQALEKEAKEKGIPLAAHCRDVLELHLMRENIENNIEKKFLEILESDKFDDVFVEKFSRDMAAKTRK